MTVRELAKRQNPVQRRRFALLILIQMLASCAPQAWKKDPDVRAARQACKVLPESERYACIERHAVETLKPDVCRMTNKWIDDMCLQAIYQAADDPTICAELYLRGVRPTCRAYYQRPAVDFVTDSVLSVGGVSGHIILAYQIAVTHWGNRAVEDLEAYLVFPAAPGLPAQVELEETVTVSADWVEPNQGMIYEGEIPWQTGLSKEEISSVVDQARIRLSWTFQGQRCEKLFPPSTDRGPGVFPSSPEPRADGSEGTG